MIMSNPIRVTVLQMLLRHVRERGTLSRGNMQLSEEEHADGNIVT